MIFPEVKKYRFVFDFLQSREVYPFYAGVRNTTNGQFFKQRAKSSETDSTNTIHVVNYIPPFLRPQLNATENRGLHTITMKYFHGFMANLSNYSTLNDYLVDKMSSKSRTKMRSYVRKLETCYNITYKLYFGEISAPHYEHLFSKFRLFIEQRFLQRGDTHELLAHWESIQRDSFEMINSKTASLFVIYSGGEPIDICLNYHFGNILHNGIRSYDIAYSKFRLGYVDIMKQLEWCFANEIQVFDLGVGDMDYKRMWCNTVYDFEHHILYPENNLRLGLIAIGLTCYYHTKEFLKKKNVHLFYRKGKRLLKKQVAQENVLTEPKFEVLTENLLSKVEDMTLLDLNHETNAFLRKPVYDFQYSNLEKADETKVYELNGKKQVYLIKGKKKMQWLKLL